jgi:hypothetical protein
MRSDSDRICSRSALLIMLIWGGCSEFERPPIAWEGDHVRVRTRLDLFPLHLEYEDSHEDEWVLETTFLEFSER